MANSKADRTIPDLSNATPSMLIDDIARMRVESARLKFLDGVYKQALEARIDEDQKKGKKPIEGEAFFGLYEEVTADRINADKVREKFKDDPEGLKQCIVTSSYNQLTTRRKGE